MLGWGFHKSLLPKMPSQEAESMLCYLNSLCGTHQCVAGSWESLPSHGHLPAGANNQHPRLPHCWKSLAFFPHKSLTGWWSFVNNLYFPRAFGLSSRMEQCICLPSDNNSWLLLEKELLFFIRHPLYLFSHDIGGDFLRSVTDVLIMPFGSRTDTWEEQARLMFSAGNQPCQPRLLPSLGYVWLWGSILPWTCSLSEPSSPSHWDALKRDVQGERGVWQWSFSQVVAEGGDNHHADQGLRGEGTLLLCTSWLGSRTHAKPYQKLPSTYLFIFAAGSRAVLVAYSVVICMVLVSYTRYVEFLFPQLDCLA